ncbi:hypothetical protein NQD34_003729 [Periophthalmus magnuspinnatus]|nr:hypothetical protein NQD34_003729 [Periophthalmus magnuspinnatus]
MSCLKCQSSHNPLAFMADLSSRFKFTSPRIRPGKNAQYHFNPEGLDVAVTCLAYLLWLGNSAICSKSSPGQTNAQLISRSPGTVPVTELEAGRACRAMSGWGGPWPGWGGGNVWFLDVP